jgi:hypothetical protein
MEKVKSYEEAFAKIQRATGISDIDNLVQTFVNAENHNFTLFNHVNDLTNELEKLEESITDVQKEIEKYKGQVRTARRQPASQLSLFGCSPLCAGRVHRA